MRILLVAQEAHPYAGVPGYVNCLASALAARHEVAVLSAGRPRFDSPSVRHIRVPAPARPKVLFDLVFWLLAALMLVWLRRRRRFDVIHSHYVRPGILADVGTSHYCEWEGFAAVRRDGHSSHAYGLRARLRGRAKVRLEARVCGRRRKKPLIVLSEGMREQFTRHHATPEAVLSVIPNGVDTERYHPRNVTRYRSALRRRYGVPEQQLLVLLIGAEWVRKGVPQAIGALRFVDDLPLKLLVVGPDDPARYRRLADRLGVLERVTFAGPTTAPCRFYAASDVFLLPSIYEPFGLVVTEAMATGLPVVVSARAGVAELIEHGVNGLLIDDPNDEAEIAAALRRLVFDGALRERLGYEARRTACENDWSRVAARNVSVYRAALAGASG